MIDLITTTYNLLTPLLILWCSSFKNDPGKTRCSFSLSLATVTYSTKNPGTTKKENHGWHTCPRWAPVMQQGWRWQGFLGQRSPPKCVASYGSPPEALDLETKWKVFVCTYTTSLPSISTHEVSVCVCVEILKSNMVVCMQASTKQIETNCVHIYNFTAKCQYRHARLKFQCVCVCWNTEKQHAGLNTGKHQAEFILLWIWRQTVHTRNFIAKHQYRHASDMLYHGSQGLGLQPNKDLIRIYKDQDYIL